MTDLRHVPWRVGTKVGRTVYAMPDDRLSDTDDVLIGLFDTPALAVLAVEEHNLCLERDH